MKFVSALRDQAKSCASLGSPFMQRLLNLLAARLRPGTHLGDRLFDWPGDISSSGQSVPLRLCAALHRLVLSGTAPGLAGVYPPHPVDDDRLWQHVSQALSDHADDIVNWIGSPPQTNEVRRAAVLIATGHWLSARFELPLMLSELGASAGLNLNFDGFALATAVHHLGPADTNLVLRPDWSGALPENTPLRIHDRRGVDLAPLDTDQADDRLRLLSYLWPDQPQRMQLTTSAMALPHATVDRADAIDWLASRLPEQPEGTLHLVYHTIAWQYFPLQQQALGQKILADAGKRATITRPLAHLSMEADRKAPGAALWLHLWPGDEKLNLGRADFHGRWVKWLPGIPGRS
ncbi:MAG: DUF2332 domain-containing protein [Paracoccaceae bacterium]